MLISKKTADREIYLLYQPPHQSHTMPSQMRFSGSATTKKSEVDSYHREAAMNRIKELQDFIGSQQSEITEFDESLVRKLIQQISVYDDCLAVRFKSGLEVNINE